VIGRARLVVPRPSSARRLLVPAALALLPWTWFACRDVVGTIVTVLAILLPVVVGVAVVPAAVLGVRRWRPALAPALSAAAMAVVAVLGPWTPADQGAVADAGAVRIVGANVADDGDAADRLVGLAADVVVVVEMTNHLVEPLSTVYPYRYFDDRGPDFGVYSRLPFRATEERGPDLPGVRVEVSGPDGPFALYALHVARPWFGSDGVSYQVDVAEHSRLLQVVAERVAAEAIPVVVVGDLNTVDRAPDYATLLERGGLVDAMRDGWGGPTSVGKWAPLLARIDHLLVGEGWCGDDARRLDLPGSDHRAVTATVGACAPAS
jgi:endonuclease/exonuclease/phosphatase (EEP) superfamily protein YafD